MDGDKIVRDQLSSIHVNFDKEAAWERLHDRLETKPTDKRYYHLGWVAALLMLIALIWQLLPAKQQPVITKVPTKKTEPRNTEQITVATNPVSIKTEQEQMIILPAAKKLEARPARKPEPVIPEALQPLVVKLIQEPAPDKKEEPVVVAKPKMKVVHINEVIEEERIEQRMFNTRYAGGRNLFLQRRTEGIEYNFGTNRNKNTIPTDPYEEYRTIQN